MMQSLSIIGAGRVGKTLASLWVENKILAIDGVVNKRYQNTIKSIDFIRAGRAYKDIGDLPLSDIYMISCNDDAIFRSAQRLASHLKRHQHQAICFHVSGSLSTTSLTPLIEIGAPTASIHPLKSFADPAMSQKNFAGTFCGIEGDEKALTVLTPLFEIIGAKPLPIQIQDKAIYHAALSMACNHLTGLISIVQQMLDKTQIPATQYNNILEHMIKHTLENVWSLGPVQALTGPIVRGDYKTVCKHHSTLKHFPKYYQSVYKQLGKALLDIAHIRQEASPESLRQIHELLDSKQPIPIKSTV